MTPIPKTLMFSLLDEWKNSVKMQKVDKFTSMLGIAVRLIVIDPYGTKWKVLSQGIHVQYESPTSSGLKVLAKVEVFSM